ncbi:PBP1A family penicillin-binding protein [Candidatus Parcubacteria bacterium]|nr:PBP1A family penicillin-binding protein [Candidatus Parcubacteria bacterium]
MRRLYDEYKPRVDKLARQMDRHSVQAVHYAKKNPATLLLWGVTLAFFVGGSVFLWAATLQLPDLSALQERKLEQSVKIYDRTGQTLLYDLHDKMQRTIVPLSSISPNMQHAVISIEDPEFYTHKGIKPMAIARAIIMNVLITLHLAGGYTQGGSTITQQVVKGSVLTNDRTLSRKLKEWVLALKLDQALSKDQILELYLNQVPVGGTMYGVEEASMTFFGKHAADLSISEAAYIAAILPAPTRLSPYGSHLDQLDTRKNLVLSKMLEHGYITQAEYNDAIAAKVAFLPPHDTSIQAPHFVFYVRQYLEDKYGTEAVDEGGWRVITTLDADMQAHFEKIVHDGALANTPKFNATNAALVAIDPKSGGILSMIGSRNYFDTEIPGAYNVTVMKPGRQPGSAFKPFAYAEAFLKGYTPDTVVFDVRTQFSTACEAFTFNSDGECYSPSNYDNKFRGPMSLRNALAQSINVPAVKVLYLAGLNDVISLAKLMGITTLGDGNRYGLTLVLGGGEVTLLDITSAYGVFAQDGVRYEPTPILRIEDADGKIIEDNENPSGSQVLDPHVAQEINDVLSDTVAREPLGVNATLNFPGYDVALKTGTTNDYRDAWTIGYTPNVVIGMWAGNNDNSPMQKKVSGLIVGPMWAQSMQYALTRVPYASFSRAEPTPTDKPILNGDWSQLGSDGNIHEILYWVDKDNPLGPAPLNPASDPQLRLWDPPVNAWSKGGFTGVSETGQ